MQYINLFVIRHIRDIMLILEDNTLKKGCKTQVKTHETLKLRN